MSETASADERARDILDGVPVLGQRGTRDRIMSAIALAIRTAEREAYERAAKVADEWNQPGEPGTAEWLSQGDTLGKVASAIRQLGEPRP